MAYLQAFLKKIYTNGDLLCHILYFHFFFLETTIISRPLVGIRNALSEITENFNRIEYIFLLFCTERRAYLYFGGTVRMWPRVPTNMMVREKPRLCINQPVKKNCKSSFLPSLF